MHKLHSSFREEHVGGTHPGKKEIFYLTYKYFPLISYTWTKEDKCLKLKMVFTAEKGSALLKR
jgi:hypothetical protein